MPSSIDAKTYPSIQTLVDEKVASRIRCKDATLYAFDGEARACAEEFMGWADLAENPPCSLDDIQAFADEVLAEGIESVVLIAQGGSIQAPMTMAQYHLPEGNRVAFLALDSDTPTGFREVRSQIDPASTLCIVSSKSGGTIEPNVLMTAMKDSFSATLSPEQIAHRFVAITDPGSDLESLAQREKWRAIFYGEPTVGGRFSALSVFGLVPAALIGIDLHELIQVMRATERRCAIDAADNPAIQLAAFLYDNQVSGRGKFSLVTPKRAATLCLWIEQLVAESTGKNGKGELPNTETDSSLMATDKNERCAITYSDAQDDSAAARIFAASLGEIAETMPRLDYAVKGTIDLVSHFVMWEYATAMLGYLMRVCPFDQPDVASTKKRALEILASGQSAPDFIATTERGLVEAHLSPCFTACDDLERALSELFGSIGAGDYFSLNAFLAIGDGRYEVLEELRHDVAQKLGAVSCLEIGPRYLHSIGQLQKGGPANGVFLLLSANDEPDIAVEGQKAPSLSALAKAQAAGDYSILAERNRRGMHLHLPDNSKETLTALRDTVRKVLAS